MGIKPLLVALLLLLGLAAFLGNQVLSQAQEIGAYQEQAKRDRAVIVAERELRKKADESLARHYESEQRALARSAQLDRLLQEAKRSDKKTREWAQDCGLRDLPCAYREWMYGHCPADCDCPAGDPTTVLPTDTGPGGTGAGDRG